MASSLIEKIVGNISSHALHGFGRGYVVELTTDDEGTRSKPFEAFGVVKILILPLELSAGAKIQGKHLEFILMECLSREYLHTSYAASHPRHNPALTFDLLHGSGNSSTLNQTFHLGEGDTQVASNRSGYVNAVGRLLGGLRFRCAAA